MAEKKTASAASKTVKPIKLTDENGEVYILEFNRATVRFAEARGFNINGLENGSIITTTEDLFYYAFRMHQPRMTKPETDRILYEKLKGMPEGMVDRLVDLYLTPVYTLAQDSDEKNATMTAEF